VEELGFDVNAGALCGGVSLFLNYVNPLLASY
jgi:hypothetical protein